MTKWAENGECRWAWCGITLHHTKTQEQHAAAWSFCAAACYAGLNVDFWHATAWQNRAAAWRSWFVKRDFYYFWKVGFRTPIVTLLLCHYKKKVVATLEDYLYQPSRMEFKFFIFSLWIIQITFERIIRRRLRNLKTKCWRFFYQLYWLIIFFYSSISFIQCLLIILWIVSSKVWVSKFL